MIRRPAHGKVPRIVIFLGVWYNEEDRTLVSQHATAPIVLVKFTATAAVMKHASLSFTF